MTAEIHTHGCPQLPQHLGVEALRVPRKLFFSHTNSHRWSTYSVTHQKYASLRKYVKVIQPMQGPLGRFLYALRIWSTLIRDDLKAIHTRIKAMTSSSNAWYTWRNSSCVTSVLHGPSHTLVLLNASRPTATTLMSLPPDTGYTVTC
jgi:hypothetical protein